MYKEITVPIGLKRFIANNADDFKRFYDTDEAPIVLKCYSIEDHHVLKLDLSSKAQDSAIQGCYAIPYAMNLENIIEHKIDLLRTGMNMPKIIASDNDAPEKEERYIVEEELVGRTLENYLRSSTPEMMPRIFSIYSNIGEDVGRAHKNEKYHGDLNIGNIIVLDETRTGFIDPDPTTSKKDINLLQLNDITACLYHTLIDGTLEYDVDKDQITKTFNPQIIRNFDMIIDSFFDGYQKKIGKEIAEKRRKETLNYYVQNKMSSLHEETVRNYLLQNGLPWSKLFVRS